MRETRLVLQSLLGPSLGAAAVLTAVRHWAPGDAGGWFWVWLGGLAAFVVWLPSGGVSGPRWSAGQVGGLVGVVTVGALLRGWACGSIPAHIDMDELLPGLEALQLAQRPSPEVFASVGWFGMPRLAFAFAAVCMAWLPCAPFVALRLSSLLLGVAGLAATAVLGRRVVGPPAALVGSGLMAVSFWHLHDSRTGFPFVQSSFCTALTLYLLVRGLQDHSPRVLAAAGVCLGFSVQGYFPLRILSVLVPLWWCWSDGHRRAAAAVAELWIVAVAAGLTLGPLVAAVPWPLLTLRSRGVLSVHSPAAFAHHLAAALGMMTAWADVSLRQRSAGPLLDSGTLAAAVIGAAVAWRRLAYGRALLLSVLLIFVLGVVVTDNPRAAYRFGPALPLIFLLAGVGACRGWTALAACIPRHSGMRWAMTFAAAGLVVAVNCRHVFIDFARGAGALDMRSAAWRCVGAACDGREFYLLSSLTPLGSPELLQLFCGAIFHQLERSSLADGIPLPDGTTATVLVAAADGDAVAALERRYPTARIAEQRADNGQLLLISADIAGHAGTSTRPVCELVDGRCPRSPSASPVAGR